MSSASLGGHILSSEKLLALAKVDFKPSDSYRSKSKLIDGKTTVAGATPVQLTADLERLTGESWSFLQHLLKFPTMDDGLSDENRRLLEYIFDSVLELTLKEARETRKENRVSPNAPSTGKARDGSQKKGAPTPEEQMSQPTDSELLEAATLDAVVRASLMEEEVIMFISFLFSSAVFTGFQQHCSRGIRPRAYYGVRLAPL